MKNIFEIYFDKELSMKRIDKHINKKILMQILKDMRVL